MTSTPTPRRTRCRSSTASGYEPIESDTEGEETYSFSGLSGSLDHVLGNAAAMDMVTGADIWDINANESVAFQYSRYNYNVTQFFDGDATRSRPPTTTPRSSASTWPTGPPARRSRSRSSARTTSTAGCCRTTANAEAGAAVLAGAVKQLRAAEPEHGLRRRG